MRRLRRSPLIRELVREITVSRSDLIQPIFVDEGISSDSPIPSMPGQMRFSSPSLVNEMTRLRSRGVRSTIIFGIPRAKNPQGTAASDPKGVVQNAVEELKNEFGDEIVVFTDVCLCQYTDHGHCGIVRDGIIQNDETLKRLAEVAVSHATAGAEVVAPSAMIDGQVKEIRTSLDHSGKRHSHPPSLEIVVLTRWTIPILKKRLERLDLTYPKEPI